MIEGTGRRSEAFADGRNRHLRYASLGDDRQSRSDEIFLAIFGMTHVLRIRIPDACVNIFIPATIVATPSDLRSAAARTSGMGHNPPSWPLSAARMLG